MDLSISIVSMNNLYFLSRCIESIYENMPGNLSFEIWAVAYYWTRENLSLLSKKFPALNVITSDDVRGYFENHNLALRRSRGKLVAILNDDIVINKDVFGPMIRALNEMPESGAICPILLNEDGSVQLAWRHELTITRFILSLTGNIGKRIAGLYPKTSLEKISSIGSTLIEIPYGTGAFIIIKRDVLEMIGYLSEEFLLGPDDVFLGHQLKEKRKTTLLLPSVSVVHTGGIILKRDYENTVPIELIDSTLMMKMFYGKSAERIAKIAVYFASLSIYLCRMIICLFNKKNHRNRQLLLARRNYLKYRNKYRTGKEYYAAIRNKEMPNINI